MTTSSKERFLEKKIALLDKRLTLVERFVELRFRDSFLTFANLEDDASSAADDTSFVDVSSSTPACTRSANASKSKSTPKRPLPSSSSSAKQKLPQKSTPSPSSSKKSSPTTSALHPIIKQEVLTSPSRRYSTRRGGLPSRVKKDIDELPSSPGDGGDEDNYSDGDAYHDDDNPDDDYHPASPTSPTSQQGSIEDPDDAGENYLEDSDSSNDDNLRLEPSPKSRRNDKSPAIKGNDRDPSKEQETNSFSDLLKPIPTPKSSKSKSKPKSTPSSSRTPKPKLKRISKKSQSQSTSTPIKRVYPSVPCASIPIACHDSTRKECPICHCHIKIDLYESHVSSHVKERHLKCDLCDRTYFNQAMLRKHKMTHDPEKYGKNCRLCGKLFFQADKKYVHERFCIRKALENEQEVDPEIIDDLKTRYPKWHLEVSPKGDPTITTPCPDCNKLVKVATLEKHRKLHTQPKNWPCQYCERAYFYKHDLVRHFATEHQDLVCTLCSKSFNDKVKLRRHVKECRKKNEVSSSSVSKTSGEGMQMAMEESGSGHISSTPASEEVVTMTTPAPPPPVEDRQPTLALVVGKIEIVTESSHTSS